MFTICICGDEKQMDDPDEQWIAQEINRRRREGQTIWVMVRVPVDGREVLYCTDNCPRGGGSRPPTPRERAILDLWLRLGLNNGAMAPGPLIEFLKRVRRMI